MKEIQKESRISSEQEQPATRSVFKFLKGLYNRIYESKKIEKIETLCDSLPDRPVDDNRSGCRIIKDGFTTEIETELRGTNPFSSRVKIQRDSEGALLKIDRTLYPFDDKGTAPQIDEFFDPSNPTESNLSLQGVVESLEQAHRIVEKQF